MPHDPTLPHRLGFVLAQDLTQEALETIATVRAEPDAKATKSRLIDCILTLTDAGLEAYYLTSLERAKVNGLGLAGARLGITTARRGISAMANRLIGSMSGQQLQSIADSMEEMLRPAPDPIAGDSQEE